MAAYLHRLCTGPVCPLGCPSRSSPSLPAPRSSLHPSHKQPVDQTCHKTAVASHTNHLSDFNMCIMPLHVGYSWIQFYIALIHNWMRKKITKQQFCLHASWAQFFFTKTSPPCYPETCFFPLSVSQVLLHPPGFPLASHFTVRVINAFLQVDSTAWNKSIVQQLISAAGVFNLKGS